MNLKKYQLENYRKYLLNRVSATAHIIAYIENCLATDDESAHHTFHKIMVHNWTAGDVALFETLSEYFSPSFVPVNYASTSTISTFYTSSLSLVLKIIKLEFLFPHQRNMYNIDILFNDKTSADCFENRITIEDIVAGVVSNRFTEKMELDLSNLSHDEEFVQKKLHFYKINLLSNFKILMLRMGRDTRSLNLSNNNLSHVPVDILNFFIKGDLKAINLSHNNIASFQELHRVSSKIEKLWVEGNPLCEGVEPWTYIKQIILKFPRLVELDGIRLNQHGVLIPFYRNFLETPDQKTKMVVETFITLYFAHYDVYPRKRIGMFYDPDAQFTLATNFTEAEEKEMVYANHSRNALHHPKKPHPKKRSYVIFNNKLYKGRNSVGTVLNNLPETIHDPTSFTVDVLKHDKKHLIIIIGGVYKEKSQSEKGSEKFFYFRRTFIFGVITEQDQSQYLISNEMLCVSFATEEMKAHCFQNPYINTNQSALHNPDEDDADALCSVLSHLTGLKKSAALTLLQTYNYDLMKALKDFTCSLKNNSISSDKFINNDIDADDFSDTSSLVDDDLMNGID